jgi:cyclopropane fatty-acyl-phospholipid synthase-like methyltransferase|tara:strand:- start:1443 stop:1856 length:414 start_codon:yes stop_codon:yes gene_type:complete
MYSKDRIDWWQGRSSSPEYQLAYDNIARRIEIMEGTLVDVGCGGGEMIKRLSPHCERIIATDNSSDMLRIAESNLENLGIRVQLIKDDIFYSKLPREISDMTLFVFPELISIGEDSPSDMILDRKLASKFNEVRIIS